MSILCFSFHVFVFYRLYLRRVALQKNDHIVHVYVERNIDRYFRASLTRMHHCDGAILSLGEFEHTVWHIHDSSIPTNSLISTSCRVHGILSKRRVSRL